MRLSRRSDERPWRDVPRSAWLALAAAMMLHASLRLAGPAPESRAEALGPPPRDGVLAASTAGEPIASAYSLALRLQAFDNQPGISVPYARLDYEHLEAWLGALLRLDPGSQYPLLMAAHLYAQVAGHPDKQRRMAAFVYREFLRDPARRWPWLAHVTVMAKHRLKDLPLAISYADALRDRTAPGQVPSWVRQMHIFLREDAGELETAKALLGALLDSGQVTDAHEFRFLLSRLEAMEDAEKSTGAPRR